MFMLMFILILVSMFWVLIDAKKLGVKKGRVKGMSSLFDMGPGGWFATTLLFWVVGFPMYLYYRGDYKLAAAKDKNLVHSPTFGSVRQQSESEAIADLEKLAGLKEKGAITAEEFELKKKQLLGL